MAVDSDDPERAGVSSEQAGIPSADALRSVLESAPIALFTLDKDGVITLSEGKALQNMGLVPGQLVGVNVFDLYRDDAVIIEMTRRALAGEEFTGTNEHYGRSFETHYRPLRDSLGAIVGILGVTVDVTDRKRAETQREELQAHLLQVQKLESLGLLAGGVAHDFNNLLTAILGSASAATMSLPEASSVRASLDNITTAARRAAALTRQLLAYSGRGHFEIRPVDLSAHARELAKLLESTLSNTLELSLELPAGLPAILADVAQLQQIIMNLVINAAEAIGDRPGKIVIATGTRNLAASDSRALVAADNLAPGSHVFLEVRDTGCGMDAATQRKIFDPFFSTKFAGRGLGLAAVIGIVRAHKGGIEVRSTPGQGSLFRVFFPATEGIPASEDRHGAELSMKGLALVVDDDPGVRIAARSLLQSFGLTVVDAVDGRDGVALFEKMASEVAFVLLDIIMPSLGGEDTLRELRRRRPDVPVVLTSGFSEFDVVARLKTDAITTFLRKPFTRHDLAEKIGLVLRRSSA